jgi:hypothetical protein
MKFDLTLENLLGERVTTRCDIFADWFELGLELDHFEKPTITKYNVYWDHEKHARFKMIAQELSDKIDRWNIMASKYDMGNLKLSDILGYTVMSSGPAFVKVENLLYKLKDIRLTEQIERSWGLRMHQEILNPMQTQMITAYRVLNDQHLTDKIYQLIDCFYTLKLLREITSSLTQNSDLMNFGLKFHDNFYPLDDEWVDRFSFERNPGEIFLYPTQIGYEYDNVMIELYDDAEFNAVKMTSNSFDLLEQMVCYTGELLFWCGDARDHNSTLDHLNYSLDNYWGGYKIKKTNTKNPYKELTWGMLKVGSFNVMPDPGFNKVVRYEIVSE